jgi:hypothetical protein
MEAKRRPRSPTHDHVIATRSVALRARNDALGIRRPGSSRRVWLCDPAAGDGLGPSQGAGRPVAPRRVLGCSYPPVLPMKATARCPRLPGRSSLSRHRIGSLLASALA